MGLEPEFTIFFNKCIYIFNIMVKIYILFPFLGL